MTKQELMETYTAEQLAEMVINYSTACFQNRVFNSLKDEIESPLGKSIEDNYKTQIKQKEEKIYKLEKECEELQSKAEKYHKSFEEEKKERDCQISEYQIKIEDLQNQIKEQKNQSSIERVSELENRHQSDCIRINQMSTTIDILVEKIAKLREGYGL